MMRQIIGHTTSRLTGWTQPLQIIIDEIPSLDRIAIVSEALDFAREYKVQLFCLTPSMGKIIATFGQHHNFLEGSFIQLVYGVYDPDVARRFSRRIGQHTIRAQRQTKGGHGTSTSEEEKTEPLMSETAVLKMPSHRVLITAGNQTCLATKARYFKPRERRLPLWGIHRRWWLRSQLPVPPRRTDGLVRDNSLGE
jgi:type IV secretory pathway TraG/TraD family ATPase VirD4